MSKLNAQTVIRQLDNHVTIFSTPFYRYNIFPVGGRSTAVKLKSGGVWLLASTPLNDVTRTKLNELGELKYIVAPDRGHYLFIKEYKDEYPDAKVVGPSGLATKFESWGIKPHGLYGKDPPDTKYGFEDDIQAEYFSGHRNEETAFYHKETKTLIEADLLFNLPAKEQHSKDTGWWPFKNSQSGPENKMAGRLASMSSTSEEKMKASMKTVAGWDIERIIPCHGEIIEIGGNEAWKKAFHAFLD